MSTRRRKTSHSKPPSSKSELGAATTSENAGSHPAATFREYAVAAKKLAAGTEAERQQFYQSWQGKRVEWQGQIERIEDFAESERLALIVASGGWRHDLLATCLFPPEMREKFAAFRRGQMVQFSGVVQDQDPRYVYLRGCKLREPAPPVAQRKPSHARPRPRKPRRPTRNGLLVRVWKAIVELGRVN